MVAMWDLNTSKDIRNRLCLNTEFSLSCTFLTCSYTQNSVGRIWYWPLKDFWRSYRKLAWVGFEPTTTEFLSDALTDWAIRPSVQLALRANFVQPLQFQRQQNLIWGGKGNNLRRRRQDGKSTCLESTSLFLFRIFFNSIGTNSHTLAEITEIDSVP